MSSFKRIIFATTLLLVVSCQKDPEFEIKNRGAVVSSEEVGTNDISTIVQNVSDFSVEEYADHDVTYYIIDYTSDYKGELKNTRGLLILPNNVDTLDLIGYFHGTHIPLNIANVDGNTPTLYRGGSEDFLEARAVCTPWASAGFAVFMPDYFGYDITEDIEHPFVYYPELFKANIDGLLAAKAFMNEKGIVYDNDLFLSGWSQGAGAAMSAHYYIQNNYADEFNIVATSGLAGPYNFYGFLTSVLDRKDESFERLGLYSWAVYAVNKFSDLERPTDQIWSYPVYDQIAASNVPSTVPAEIVNPFFLSKINDKSDTAMIRQLELNSFHEGWTPVGNVFLHHGDADDVVPYFNSVDAFDGLSAAGATIKFYSYPGGDHGNILEEYATTTIKDFKSLQ